MFPPPNYTVGMVFLGWYAVSFDFQTWCVMASKGFSVGLIWPDCTLPVFVALGSWTTLLSLVHLAGNICPWSVHDDIVFFPPLDYNPNSAHWNIQNVLLSVCFVRAHWFYPSCFFETPFNRPSAGPEPYLHLPFFIFSTKFFIITHNVITQFMCLWFDFVASVKWVGCYQHMVRISFNLNFRNIFTWKFVMCSILLYIKKNRTIISLFAHTEICDM